MSSTIEKELKTALSLEHYQALFSFFKCDQLPLIKQENYYFDTANGILRQNNVGLRIRLATDKSEFTLKEPLNKYEKIETTDWVSLAEGRAYLATQTFPDAQVAQCLTQYGVALDMLQQIGYLKNERYEIAENGALWVLDKSYFTSGITYELEYEYSGAPDKFFLFLKEHDIPYRTVSSKLARAVSRA